VLPLHLFSIRAFSVVSVVGFIVGFAMFGAITYLPVFFQIVHGESPTTSGLQLLPLLAGLIICSTGSGIIISKTGRYRFFPIAGTALIAVALFLLSQVGIGTSLIVAALYMFVLGVGLGCVMQVLVLIAQNAVPYSELGVATSGATFFRSIGGCFGAAIFGAIFSNVLVGNLVRHLGNARLPAGLSSSSVTPAILDKLPQAVHHGVAAAYAESIQTVFLIAAPIGFIAFFASWLIPQVELRRGVGASPGPPADAPTAASDLAEREPLEAVATQHATPTEPA
jgi:MFS family permease